MKPDFLTTPEAWTRTGRVSHDPVAYGCSIEGCKVARYDRWVNWAFAIAIGVLCGWGLVEALS